MAYTNYQWLLHNKAGFIQDKQTGTIYAVYTVMAPNMHLFIKLDAAGNDSDTDLYNISSGNVADKESARLLCTGTDNLELGGDYFISASLYNFIYSLLTNTADTSSYVLPDIYLAVSKKFNTDRYDLFEDNPANTAQNIKYYRNLDTLNKTEFTKDQLDAFCNTFFKIIRDMYDSDNVSVSTTNEIYKIIVNYFAAGTDTTSATLKLLLSSAYTTTVDTVDSSCTSCGGSSVSTGSSSSGSSNNTNLSSESCADLYLSALQTWLQQMMSDIKWYCEWFGRYNESGTVTPNIPMIDMLIKLIDAFLSQNYDLSFTDTDTHCGCPDDYTDDDSYCNNRGIITNFKQVLEWLREGKINEHSNMISLYGKQFAALLPKLIF